MAQDMFRRVFVCLVVQAVDAAEIRNPAFGLNAGAAKKDDVVRMLYHICELFYCCHNEQTSL